MAVDPTVDETLTVDYVGGTQGLGHADDVAAAVIGLSTAIGVGASSRLERRMKEAVAGVTWCYSRRATLLLR